MSLRIYFAPWLALVLMVVAAALPAVAEEDGRGFGLSLGVYDFDDELPAAELGLDYHFAPILLKLVPHVGIHMTEDETYYGYFGMRRHWDINSRWLVTGSLAAALLEPGDGKDLGSLIEFRSGLVLGRRLKSGGRVGLGFFHLSNSGVSRLNPGANSLLLRYVFPPRKRK